MARRSFLICATALIMLTCPVIAAAQPAGADAPTFTRDVAPIIFERCAGCHRPGEVGPFPLLTYDDVSRRARQIVEVTASRFMPPSKAEPGYGGPFVGNRRLTDDEIALIARWAEAGTPRGNRADLPPLPEWTEGWQLGVPDVVVTMDEPYTVAAGGADTFRNFVIPIPLDAPRYVAGLEFRPDNTRVAHHANLRIDRSRSSRQLDDQDPRSGYDGPISPNAQYPDGHFLGWTPGQVPPLAGEGMAWRLEPGSDLVVQLHLQPSGREETLRASVGFFFTDQPPDRTPVMLRLGRQNIDIPPGEPAYTIRDRFELPVDVDLIGVQPHAHFRATEIKGRATFPDGREEWIVYIPDWDFNWQDVYRLETPLSLPKGTTLTMEYTYDNSANNPRNPDRPPRRVLWGQFSSDEMGDLWFQVVTRTEADRATLFNRIMPKVLNEDIVGFETMLLADPDNPVLHRDAAALYIALDRIPAAINHYRRAMALDPYTATDPYNLATLLVGRGSLDEAVSLLRRALELQPDHPQAHNNLGAVLQSQGRIDEATLNFRRAVELEPVNAEAHNNLGNALAMQGQLDEGIRALRQALALQPGLADAHHNLGNTLTDQGKVSDAIVQHRRAMEAAPDWVPPMSSLAWLLATAADETLRAPAEAVAIAERSAAITDRQHVGVLDTLAAAYASAGDFDQAVTAETDAVALATGAGATGIAAELERRLATYRAGRPYQEP